MKVKKLNEMEEHKMSYMVDELSKKLADKFFGDFGDFNRIEVKQNSYSKEVFNFFICFRSITPFTVDKSEELHSFMNFSKKL